MNDISCFLNKHNGEEAWVFGKGPSLDTFDMGEADSLRICVNESVAVVPSPTYFFAHDEVPIKKVAEKWNPECCAILQKVRAEYACKCGIPEKCLYIYTKDKKALKLSQAAIAQEKTLYGCTGTVHSALHFCHLVGVTHINLIGFDGKGNYARCLEVPGKGSNHERIKRDSIAMLEKLGISYSFWKPKKAPEIKQAWQDPIYENDDKRYSWLYQNGYGEGPVKRLIEYDRDSLFSCKKILDAGCGLQTFAKYMKESGYQEEIVGVDLSSYIAKNAKHCKVIHTALDEIPLADNYFDGIFSCDVLEHIHEQKIAGTLQELSRLLAPGGYWVFSIGTARSHWKGPNKENLHVTMKPASWWQERIAETLGPAERTQIVPGGVLLKGTKTLR